MHKLEDEIDRLGETALRIAEDRRKLLALVRAGVTIIPNDSTQWNNWINTARAVLVSLHKPAPETEESDIERARR